MWPDTVKMWKCAEKMGTSQQFSHSNSHPTLHCTTLTIMMISFWRNIQKMNQKCCSETNNTDHRIVKHWTASEKRTLTALSNYHSVKSTAIVQNNLLPAFGFNCIPIPVKIRAKKRFLLESANKIICIAIPSIPSRRVTFVCKDKQIHQVMLEFCVYCDQLLLFLIF